MISKILKTLNAIYPVFIYLILSFFTVIVFAVGYMIMGRYYEAGGLEEILDRYSLIITMVSALICIPIMLLIKYFDDKKDDINLRHEREGASFKEYVIIFFSAIGACVFLNNIISVSGLSSIDKRFNDSIKMIYTNNIPIQLIAAGIIIPIIEELIFREIMFRRLRATYNTVAAIIISSLAFAIFHGNITQGVYAFILGVFIAYVYAERESLFLCIMIHIMANITSILMSTDMFERIFFSNIFIVILITLISLILWAFAIFYLVINDFKINTEEVKEGENT